MPFGLAVSHNEGPSVFVYLHALSNFFCLSVWMLCLSMSISAVLSVYFIPACFDCLHTLDVWSAACFVCLSSFLHVLSVRILCLDVWSVCILSLSFNVCLHVLSVSLLLTNYVTTEQTGGLQLKVYLHVRFQRPISP